jgi:hypothetical protein
MHMRKAPPGLGVNNTLALYALVLSRMMPPFSKTPICLSLSLISKSNVLIGGGLDISRCSKTSVSYGGRVRLTLSNLFQVSILWQKFVVIPHGVEDPGPHLVCAQFLGVAPREQVLESMNLLVNLSSKCNLCVLFPLFCAISDTSVPSNSVQFTRPCCDTTN